MTIVVCAAFGAFVAFILIGCSLFMHPSTIIPSLISSSMVLLSAVGMVRSGKVPMKYASNSGITASIGKHLAPTQKMTGVATKLISAKDAKSMLVAADELERRADGRYVAPPKKKASTTAKPSAKKKVAPA